MVMERNQSLSVIVVFLFHCLMLSQVMASSVTNNDITTDQNALLALKAHIINDPNTVLANNWTANTSVCSWIGVTCDVPRSRVAALNISHLSLTGTVPAQLGNLSSLKKLDLSFNHFSGSMPSSIFNISSLEILNLRENQLSGNSFASVCSYLRNLEYLDLSKNNFDGKILSALSKCKHLQYLYLSSNHFRGGIPDEIGNLTKLTSLWLDDNQLQGEIPREIGNLGNLETLVLENNPLGGLVPATIFNMSAMRVLSLNNNKLSGTLPSNIDLGLPNLEEIYLPDNNFSGTIPSSIANISKLRQLEMSGNSFSGFITSTIGNLRSLEWLNLGNNHLTSSTPDLSFLSSLTNCKNLREIKFFQNPIHGILPRSMGNLSSSLRIIIAGYCNIRGNIPEEIGNLKELTSLRLGNNKLTGPIPISFGRMQNLQGLYLLNNKLEGSIPVDLCHLDRLVDLYLSGNKLSGSLPACLGNLNSLRDLSLSSNGFTSIIPSSLWNLKDILHFNLSSNYLDGPLPLDIGNFEVAIDIDLSRNRFSGDIPTNIGGLKNLQRLSLRCNRLQGQIPESFGALISLEFLDLSNNNITGAIPESLEALLYLKYLNLSSNRLEGEIPTEGSFVNFSAESVVGNPALCGSQLQVSPCKTNLKGRNIVLLRIILPLSIALTILVLTLVLLKCQKRRTKIPNDSDMSPQASWRRISYYELVRATDGFTEHKILGIGGFGSVYKGRLEEGLEVAIKVFHQQFEEALKSFDAECEVMSNIRHRNLVKIITSYSNEHFKALVLEYMPNGSLEKLLYSEDCFMDILQRLNIMIDVASALEYLLFSHSIPVIHCVLKPSNVLLDKDMVARLSDFGISKLLGEQQSMTLTRTLASIGYMAPEYGREGKVSRKAYVYSFGIMLVEIFTRKKPTNEFFCGEMSLKHWVSDSLHSTVLKVVDKNMLRSDDEHFYAKEKCVSSILSLAMECTRESPEQRIGIKEVASGLLKIRDTLLADTRTTAPQEYKGVK